MLKNLSEEIRSCYQHAEDCARKAAEQTDPQLKQDFLDLEQSWLFLARGYGFTERLTDFSDETKRQVSKLPKVYSGTHFVGLSSEYHLICRITGESHGGFETLTGARQYAHEEALQAWDIFHGNLLVERREPE